MMSLEISVGQCLTACWKASVPQREKAFGWRCVIDRLSLKNLLIRRGIIIDSMCVLCQVGDGDGYHLYKVCTFSKQAWNDISSWLGFEVGLDGSVAEGLSSWVKDCRKMGISKDSAYGIWISVLWCVWRYRNEVIFNGMPPSNSDLV